MAGSSVAGVITACASVLTALGLLLTAVGVLVPILRKTRQVQAAVGEVHVMVNQQRTDAQNYNRALADALRAAGIPVPADQSLVPPPAPPA